MLLTNIYLVQRLRWRRYWRYWGYLQCIECRFEFGRPLWRLEFCLGLVGLETVFSFLPKSPVTSVCHCIVSFDFLPSPIIYAASLDMIPRILFFMLQVVYCYLPHIHWLRLVSPLVSILSKWRPKISNYIVNSITVLNHLLGVLCVNYSLTQLFSKVTAVITTAIITM